MTTGFRVHPVELAAAGRSGRSTAELLRLDVTAAVAPLDAAVAALPGWRTASALHDCTEAWRLVLVALTDELATIGADLERTAANYTAADALAHRALLPPS
ncbi:hypothetical protein [Kitasatospora cinereorecta]|uniref:Excreted virulence factor EspC (Type VII ESX diderm) n=1 Tax=Kitasatospora cinereorecta TaxID=285560 RepID=A0ABW0VL95_9ACTN